MHFRRYRKLVVAVSAASALAWAGCSSSGGGSGSGGSSANGGGGSGGKGGTGGSNSGGTGAIVIGGSGGGGAGGSGGSAGDACASTVVQGKLVPANLLFVIDRSGSMTCNLPSDGQPSSQCDAFPAPIDPSKPSKWQLTSAALSSAVDDLQAAGNVSAGMVVFPRPNTDCSVTQTPDVEIKPLDAAQDGALKTFLGTVAPGGSTPLAGATILSYAYLYDLLKAGSLNGNVFVVLLTDGYETCAPSYLTELLGQDVPNALSVNIRTFVIGVPGSENGRALLSQIAWQGGTPKSPTCTHDPAPNDVGDCHFDMTTSSNFGQDLKNALAQISGTVVSCEIDVPAPPPGKKINTNDVTVQVNNQNVPKADPNTPCAQAQGWQFNQDQTKIYLCGTACDDAKKSGDIAVNLGCLSNIR